LVGHALACPYSHAISTPRFSLRRRGGRIAAGIARLRFTGKLILKPFRDGAQWICSERQTVS
jgi:hypothetical protein